jgi:hypothetical protein
MTRLYLFLGLTLCVAGCDIGNEPAHVKSFDAIVGIERDSLYWEEASSLQIAQNFDRLRLFVATTEAKIDSIVGTRVHFRLPVNSFTGIIRLYAGNTLISGTRQLHVIPDNFLNQGPHVQEFWPFSVYPNDLIRVIGKSLPLRRDLISATIGEREAEVVSFGKEFLYLRVPPNATSGQLTLALFDTVLKLGTVKILTDIPTFLLGLEPRHFRFRAYRLSGYYGNTYVSIPNDSLVATFDYTEKLPKNAKLEYRVDSIFSTLRSVEGNDSIEFSMKLGRGLVRNRASGKIRIERYSRNSRDHKISEIVLNNTSWRKVGGGYQFFSQGPDIRKDFSDYSFYELRYVNEFFFKNFQGGEEDSYFFLELTP